MDYPEVQFMSTPRPTGGLERCGNWCIICPVLELKDKRSGLGERLDVQPVTNNHRTQFLVLTSIEKRGMISAARGH
jgi:hypothetical protein